MCWEKVDLFQPRPTIPGLKDETRSKYKLLLSCTLIITSVVPPELPMELSLAVNTSLLALQKLGIGLKIAYPQPSGIFCTEPFRIPFAGKIHICCFDKTGTLTTDKLVMKGIAGLKYAWVRWGFQYFRSDTTALSNPSEAPRETLHVLAGCHSLINVNGKLAGDPIEITALNAINWTCSSGVDIFILLTVSGDQIISNNPKEVLELIHRYHFSSSLQRMSVVARQLHKSDRPLVVLTKGAPEKILEFLDKKHVPDKYVETYKHFAREGMRVLALAYKYLPDITSIEVWLSVRVDLTSRSEELPAKSWKKISYLLDLWCLNVQLNRMRTKQSKFFRSHLIK